MEVYNRYYAKWNKSDRGRQILYDFTFRWNLKIKTKQINPYNKTETELQRTNKWLPEQWAGRKKEIGDGD